MIDWSLALWAGVVGGVSMTVMTLARMMGMVNAEMVPAVLDPQSLRQIPTNPLLMQHGSPSAYFCCALCNTEQLLRDGLVGAVGMGTRAGVAPRTVSDEARRMPSADEIMEPIGRKR
jgi:H+/Cl- antiporter ClcA